jgi:HD-GYP domain-containing protein (c-di-GMP phosphodiesterase class II)
MLLINFLFGIITLFSLFLFLREKHKNSLSKKAWDQGEHKLDIDNKGFDTYARIGKFLSHCSGLNELLELILDECQHLSNADAGTLYLYDKESETLDFAIMHTNSQNIRQGGTSGNKIKLPPVPLYKENLPNHENVCSSCALSGERINIPDLYKEEGFNFTGTRQYDSSTGYRSHSMLVLPMKDLEGNMIGVIQLINAQDRMTDEPISFTENHANQISLLTAHAASTLNNVQLTEQLKELFNAFIRSIASTIDGKSPYTGDHIRRVVTLTMMITNAVDEAKEGPFKNVHFSDAEKEEIRQAAWLHDIGKLTTPDNLVNKATKLELFQDRIELIKIRFRLMEELAATEEEKALLREEIAFLENCNNPGENMDESKLTKLREIFQKTWILDGETRPVLTPDEYEKLAIKRGTLTKEEKALIENHVFMTKTILDQLPFPEFLSQVPEYASMHHEKLNGTGYFRGLTEKEIPLQARIIAVSDIFEALTARDRPYRKPIVWDRALEIIKKMADNNELDSRLHDLLFSSGVAQEYSRQELEDS